MENFVIAGKAKNVFELIRLKAERERELNGSPCPYDPDQQARCNIVDPCGKVGCQVYMAALERARKEMKGR